jgi:hypothetical protein
MTDTSPEDIRTSQPVRLAVGLERDVTLRRNEREKL